MTFLPSSTTTKIQSLSFPWRQTVCWRRVFTRALGYKPYWPLGNCIISVKSLHILNHRFVIYKMKEFCDVKLHLEVILPIGAELKRNMLLF
jgi:hypothetical protein